MKRIAIVTGGCRGIGKAISERLVNEDHFVYVADLPSEIQNAGMSDHVTLVPCDITSAEEVSALYRKVKKEKGKLDLLVNNAGIILDNMIWKMPEEEFDKVIDVNLKGCWLMCKEAAMMMREQLSGRIVNIASRAWLGNKGQSNYSASKAGVIAMTRVLALELGKYNVCVNAVAPGLIDTPLTRKLKPEVLQSLIQAQPTLSMGTPQDVARAVAFLGSPETNFITGQVLYVDGGKSISSNLF